MTCGNCKTKMGCSCQRRTAADGTSVCNLCVNTYNASIRKPGVTSTNAVNNIFVTAKK